MRKLGKILACCIGFLLVYVFVGTAPAGATEEDAENSYSCFGVFEVPCSNAVDENWDSYAYCGQQFCEVLEIYDIPTGVNSAEWTIKIGVMRFDPFSTKVRCYNYDISGWTTVVDISGTEPGYTEYMQTIDLPSGCLNGDKLEISTDVLDFASGDSRYFEGKINWETPVPIPEFQHIAIPAVMMLMIGFLVSRK